MRIEGDNNVQAGRDVVFQIISGLKDIQDVDAAITGLHRHMEQLQFKRGMKDSRILLAVLAGTCAITGYVAWNWWTPVLFVVAIILIYFGSRVRMIISKIDVEISAVNMVLVELYKQKISHQLI